MHPLSHLHTDSPNPSPLTCCRTPLHCAASCNNLAMVRLLVENGACIFATTVSDEETAAEKCEEDEEGYRGCSEYLYSKYQPLISRPTR